MDEILWCDHLNNTSSAGLSHGTVYLECNSNFCMRVNIQMKHLSWYLFLLTGATLYKQNLPHFFRNRPWPLLAEPEPGLTLVTFNADIMNYRQASWIWVRKYYGNSVHKYLIRPSLLTVKQHQYTHLIWGYLKDMPADLCWTTLLKTNNFLRIVDTDEKVENSCPKITLPIVAGRKESDNPPDSILCTYAKKYGFVWMKWPHSHFPTFR